MRYMPGKPLATYSGMATYMTIGLLVGAVSLFAAFSILGGNGSATTSAAAPTAIATQDAFPEPGKTFTKIRRVKVPGGVETQTVRAYTTISKTGKRKLIRETISEPVPGVKVTSTKTVIAPGPKSTTIKTVPGDTTTQVVEGPGRVETQVVEGPGRTETVAGPVETVTVPGPETTTTVTEPGPEVTVTETVTVEPPPPPAP